MHFLIFKPCKSIYVQIIFFIFLDSRLPQQNTNNFIHENTVEKRYEIVDELAQPTKNDKGQKREKTHVPSILFEDTTELKQDINCLLYTSPSPRDGLLSRMPSSA